MYTEWQENKDLLSIYTDWQGNKDLLSIYTEWQENKDLLSIYTEWQENIQLTVNLHWVTGKYRIYSQFTLSDRKI